METLKRLKASPQDEWSKGQIGFNGCLDHGALPC